MAGLDGQDPFLEVEVDILFVETRKIRLELIALLILDHIGPHQGYALLLGEEAVPQHIHHAEGISPVHYIVRSVPKCRSHHCLVLLISPRRPRIPGACGVVHCFIPVFLFLHRMAML